jgi:hypothetical protein
VYGNNPGIMGQFSKSEFVEFFKLVEKLQRRF